MHINRKPGEQVEVDWAGDLATIIDPDTGEIIKAYIFVVVMTYSQYAYEEWCEQLGSNASSLADAIIDRIAHDSFITSTSQVLIPNVISQFVRNMA